ncbi:MAG: hypothetical protein GX882_05885 [Methanomicrobiales archaeon]|nr:hypothetical protein [Methanomicrobiales archaeon]
MAREYCRDLIAAFNANAAVMLENTAIGRRGLPRPREGDLPRPAEAPRDSVPPVFSRPSDVPEDVLSNRITARRRAHMKTPRGGIRERAGRRRGLPGRKGDGMAGDRSPGDLREGGRPPLSVRAGPGAIDSFCIAALVVFWSIAGPEGDGWSNFE